MDCIAEMVQGINSYIQEHVDLLVMEADPYERERMSLNLAKDIRKMEGGTCTTAQALFTVMDYYACRKVALVSTLECLISATSSTHLVVTDTRNYTTGEQVELPFNTGVEPTRATGPR